MTPGRKTNLHYVPYDGNIETHIDDSRASALMIHETPDVSRTLMTQVQRMIDANVEGFRYALPTANGVLVNCNNAQQAYDAVYGGIVIAANKESNVVAFKPFTSVALNAEFSGAAQNDQGVSRAPVLHGAFDRATKVPALSGFDFEARALAA